MDPLVTEIAKEPERAPGAPPVRRCRAMSKAPLFDSAIAAADAISRKKISSVELTRDTLTRIDEYNADINAVVTLDREGALESAKRADDSLSRGAAVGSLHGVPCSVKDTFEVAGMRTTAGSRLLVDHVPAQDADVVSRLRAAGAVIIGKTNTPSFGAEWQTYNLTFGTTNNPWDLSLTPGGSSGGAAAAVAAGFEYVTVGSDLGGSIRGPAHFCGVYGHKPSLNVVSMRGHIPPYPASPIQDFDTLVVAGPLARTAADLHLALSLIGGPHGDAAKAFQWRMPAPRRQRLRDYRIGFVLDHPACPVSSELSQPLVEAIEALRRAGADMREGWPDGVVPAAQRETYEYIAATYRATRFKDKDIEELRARAARPEGGIGDILARAVTEPIGSYLRVLRDRVAARVMWQQYFREHDAFLAPVTFVPAFPHDQSTPQSRRGLRTPEGVRNYLDLTFWSSFATLAGLPATVAPIGETLSGLPVGIQIIGPFLEDATPIDIAARMAELVGFRPDRP